MLKNFVLNPAFTSGKDLNKEGILWQRMLYTIRQKQLYHSIRLLHTGFGIFYTKMHKLKSRIKEHMFGGFRLILFLDIWCFMQNQPENVLKVLLKLFLKIKDYRNRS